HAAAARRQLVGGGESADARADDHDWLRAQGSGLEARGQTRNAWTWRASAWTFSSGVFGSTPCPRLKIWPGRPPARTSTSSAAVNILWVGPSRRVGSSVLW